MPQVINTNIASLNAQRNLNETQGAADTALERLSSGLRINSAKDDAAGLAISERFTAQVNGLNQAVRNANDGISLAQVTEGALDESANSLQRIRELAIQSANATNSQSDRDALQAEVSQLQEEIDRIATQTEFNGLNVLDGSYVEQQYQVGANANQTIGISIDSAKANEIGSVVNQAGSADQTGAASVVANGNLTNASDLSPRSGVDSYNGVSSDAIDPSSPGTKLTINGQVVEASKGFEGTLNGQDETSAYAKAAAINGSSIDGVTAQAQTEKVISGINSDASGDGSLLASFQDGGTADGDTANYSLSINGTQVIEEDFAEGEELGLSAAQDRINQFTDDTGVRAEVNTDGNLALSAEDGRNIKLDEDMSITNGSGTSDTSTLYSAFLDNTGFAQDADGSDSSMNGDNTNTYTYRGQITLQSQDNVALEGDGAGNGGSELIGFDNSLLEVQTDENIATVDISDVEGANQAILAVDSALQKINGIRADLGAVQNRFESTISNLEAGSENLSAARSRIQDADFAKESAELSRTQTLQQAGISVLSQANQRPQQVLQLIQG